MTLVQPFRDSKLQLNEESREAFWKDQRVDLLSPKSFSILRLLSNAPDKTHSLSAVKKAANIRKEAEDAFVCVEIALIKRAFTNVDPNGAPITVIPRQGYKWNEPALKLKERLAAFFRRSPET